MMSCAWLKQQLGFGHGLPAIVCEACAGHPETSDVMITARRMARINRILTDTPQFASTWEGHPTAEEVIAKLVTDDGMTLDEIERDVLLRAVNPEDQGRQGMSAARAAELGAVVGLK